MYFKLVSGCVRVKTLVQPLTGIHSNYFFNRRLQRLIILDFLSYTSKNYLSLIKINLYLSTFIFNMYRFYIKFFINKDFSLNDLVHKIQVIVFAKSSGKIKWDVVKGLN
jgi:hypothetical protein